MTLSLGWLLSRKLAAIDAALAATAAGDHDVAEASLVLARRLGQLIEHRVAESVAELEATWDQS